VISVEEEEVEVDRGAVETQSIDGREEPSIESDKDSEEDASTSNLAKRVYRRDTFALRLGGEEKKPRAPVPNESESTGSSSPGASSTDLSPTWSHVAKPGDDIANQTSDERKELMRRVSIKLERKLSQRPSANELEERNILKRDNEDESITGKEAMEKTRRILMRKLSFRPTVHELKEQQIIKFNEYVEVEDAEQYDRRADKPWLRLTPVDKALIRKELNDFKATEMDVHEESKQFTRFHRP